MIIYFDNSGKLVTMTPHGEVPRQCGDLELYVLLNKNFNNDSTKSGQDGQGIQHRTMTVRFKTPSTSYFSEDYPATRVENTWQFEKLNGESIGSLIDGEEYYAFYFNLTETNANKEAGNLELVFTMWKYNETGELDEDDNPILVEDSAYRLQFGLVKIYIEETLGLAPYDGVGMTYNQYKSLMAYLANISDYVNTLKNLKADLNNENQVINAGMINATNSVNVNGKAVTTKDYVDNAIASLRGIVDSLLGEDITSFVSEFNSLKNNFNNFMTSSSADSVVNTLSEIQTSLNNINTSLSNIYTKSQADARVAEIINNTFADVSEEEF